MGQLLIRLAAFLADGFPDSIFIVTFLSVVNRCYRVSARRGIDAFLRDNVTTGFDNRMCCALFRLPF